MRLTLAELGKRLGAEVVGDGERCLTGIKALDRAGPDDVSFLHNPKYLGQAQESAAGVVIVKDPAALPGRDLLVSAEPYLSFARALEIFNPPQRPPAGVHPSAAVADDAVLALSAAVGPQAAVGAGSRVGENSIIGAGCVLGAGVEVGQDCLLHPRVVIEDRCRVGDRCVLHAGVVIGSDGYGFATVGATHHKVPQVGAVEIEDDVELGANVCIDRGTLGNTRIGRGSKVDNLVQIAHNVDVGEGCLLVAQVGVSGSTKIGHHTVMAGQSGAAGHLEIGAGAIISAKTAVMKDIPEGAFVSGIPARPHREWLTANANVKRIDALRKSIKKLEAEVAAMKEES